MKISELAKRCGVSSHALRHYERLGLLQPVRRDNGYREYSESMRREVIFILMSRKIGFSLAAIAEQLPIYRAGRLSIADMVESLHRRIVEIDQQIVDLGVIRDEVRSHIEWLQAPQKSKSPSPSPSKQPRKRKTP
jgi:MerR family transcriptional regulator, copper efflux regulator